MTDAATQIPKVSQLAETTPPEEALEEELTEVELLCEQRNYSRAQTIAQRLLRAHPTSARVHEVMADVAAARGGHAEAVQWYELALQLGFDQRVMDKVSEQRRLLEQSQREASETEDMSEEGEPQRHYKLIAAIAGGVILLAFVVFLIFVIKGNQPSEIEAGPSRPRAVATRSTRDGQASRQPAPSEAAAPPSRATASAPARRSGGRHSPISAPQQPQRQNLPPVHLTREIGAPLTDQDRRLLKAIGSLTWPGGRNLSGDVNAMVDPFTGYAFITIELPASLKQSVQFATAINMSYRVAVAAMRQNTSIRSLTVRVIVPVTTGDTETVLTVFRGNADRATLDRYLDTDAMPSTRDIWRKVFATTWWNPSVSAENPFE